jgi:hypothetical protein
MLLTGPGGGLSALYCGGMSRVRLLSNIYVTKVNRTKMGLTGSGRDRRQPAGMARDKVQ